MKLFKDEEEAKKYLLDQGFKLTHFKEWLIPDRAMTDIEHDAVAFLGGHYGYLGVVGFAKEWRDGTGGGAG